MRAARALDIIGKYPFVGLVLGLTTMVLLPLRPILTPAQLMLLYVPVIIWLARLVGMRASVVAAVFGFLAVDLLFVPPYYHITVSSPMDWVTLVLFFGVAIAAGLQTGRMREREHQAVQRQRELALLNRLSSRLVSQDTAEAIGTFIVHETVSVLNADRAVLFTRGQGGSAELLVEAGRDKAGLSEPALAAWVMRGAKAVGLPPADDDASGFYPVSVDAALAIPGAVADGVFVPLQTATGIEGVLYARSADGHGFDSSGARQIVAVANLAAAFLERRRLEEAAAHATALRESDRLKASFVSSVSHELKTPLAAVSARITGLLDEGEGCDAKRVRSELSAASEDLGRLDASIRDLVDVSRLESDAWRANPDVYDLGEILGVIAGRLPVAQRGRVHFEVPEGLPALRVDLGQIARAVLNVIDNAFAYAGASAPVIVGARVLGGSMLLWVEDRGPGVPDNEKQRVFDKFYRGTTSASSAAGTGLGLAIVGEIVRSHGGQAWIEDVQPSGARFILSLPLEGTQS